MFHAAARATYDVALCMYHDQALIPIKTLAFDEAVNVTLGLPFVRTSPDHGTAFDIAGTGARRSRQPDRRRSSSAAMAAPRGAADTDVGGLMRRDRRSAAAARGHRAHELIAPRSRSARISCSTSTSPRASRALPARSTAST